MSGNNDRKSSQQIENTFGLIAKGSVSFGVTGLIEQILLLIQGMITFRILDKITEMPIFNTAFKIFSYAGTLTFTVMVNLVMIKKISVDVENASKIRTILTSYIFFAVVTSAIFVGFFGICYLLGVFLNTDILFLRKELLLPTFILSFSIFLAVIEFRVLFIGLRKYIYYNILKLITIFVHFVFCVGFLLIFEYFTTIPSYYGIFLGLVLKCILMIGVTAIIVRKIYGKFFIPLNRKNFALVLRELRFMFREGFALGISNILYQILALFPGIILYYYVIKDIEVSYFAAITTTGFNLSRIMSLLLGQMILSIIPTYLKHYNYEATEKITGYVSKVILYLIALLLIGVLVYSDIFVWIFYEEGYLPISKVLFIGFFEVLYTVISISFSPILNGLEKIHTLIYLNLIRSIVFFIFAFLFTPRYGYNGMLIAVSITYIINIITSIIISIRASKINYFRYYKQLFIVTSIILAVLAAIGYFIFDYLGTISALIDVLIRIPVLLGIYLVFHVIVFSTGIVNKSDISMIKTISLSIISKIPYKTKFLRWIHKISSQFILWIFCLVEKIPLKPGEPLSLPLETPIKSQNVCLFIPILPIHHSKVKNGAVSIKNPLIDELIQQGYHVTIIASKHPKGYFHEEKSIFEEYYYVGNKIGKEDTSYYKESASTYDKLNNFKHFDFVHAINFASLGLVKFSKFSSPLFLSLENSWREQTRSLMKNRKLGKGIFLIFSRLFTWFEYTGQLKRADKIFVSSKSDQINIWKDLPYSAEKISVVTDNKYIKYYISA